MELLEFVVAQYVWCSWEVHPHEFTSSTKKTFQRVSFPTEAENPRIHEIISPREKQKTP